MAERRSIRPEGERRRHGNGPYDRAASVAPGRAGQQRPAGHLQAIPARPRGNGENPPIPVEQKHDKAPEDENDHDVHLPGSHLRV